MYNQYCEQHLLSSGTEVNTSQVFIKTPAVIFSSANAVEDGLRWLHTRSYYLYAVI